MAAALDRPVRLGSEVRRIEDDGRGVTVRCAGGAAHGADRVVCSLPFPVLRQVALDPPLAGRQAEAVAGLPSQSVTQLHFRARSRFWETDGLAPSLYTDGPAGMFAAVRGGEDAEDVDGFTAWLMGAKADALDALPDREAAARVIRAVEAVRPAARNQLEFVGLKSWGADPYARGAWATFRPGQVTRFAAAMRPAHGRIHFCGEHLAEAARGMEGAMESGERAAPRGPRVRLGRRPGTPTPAPRCRETQSRSSTNSRDGAAGWERRSSDRHALHDSAPHGTKQPRTMAFDSWSITATAARRPRAFGPLCRSEERRSQRCPQGSPPFS